MNILLLSHYFQPENVAPQRRWDELARRFIAAGHSVTVLCPPPHYPAGRVAAEHRQRYRPGSHSTTDYGACVIRTRYLPHGADIVTRTADHLVSAADGYSKGVRLARSRAWPDVVIATAPGIPTLLAGRYLARRLHVPLISEMRDAWPDLVTHTPGFLARRGIVAWAKRMVHRRITGWQVDADRVIVTTTRFADVLESRGVRNPVVIRNGASTSRFDFLPVPDAESRLRVLYMGNMGRSQGLETVVRAAAELKREGVPIEVRLVGHGADRSTLRRLNAALGSPVDIRDEVPAGEVHAHYAWADSLIVSLRAWGPLEWTVPSKLYESLATGKHVTGLLAGEAADVLMDAGGGHLVSPGDVSGLENLWRGLLTDRRLLLVGAAGREWVAAHADYDQLAREYLDIVRSVATSHTTT